MNVARLHHHERFVANLESGKLCCHGCYYEDTDDNGLEDSYHDKIRLNGYPCIFLALLVDF